MACTYDYLTGRSPIMYVLTYDGAWQRHDGRAETDADQHAASRSSSQPSRLVDEHQPKDCLVENGSRAKKARSGRVAQIPHSETCSHRFQSLGAVDRMWNERISKVISLSTARRRFRRQSLFSKVTRRKPLFGPHNTLLSMMGQHFW